MSLASEYVRDYTRRLVCVVSKPLKVRHILSTSDLINKITIFIEPYFHRIEVLFTQTMHNTT